MCAWLWPSLATDIFGKGNPTPSFRMLQFSRRDSFSSIETYKVATNTRVIGSFAKRFWAGLTGMSLAMDGQPVGRLQLKRGCVDDVGSVIHATPQIIHACG